MSAILSWNETRNSPSLDGPFRKIERANEHIENLSTNINCFLGSCGYKVRRDFEGDPPFFVVTVEEVNFPPVPDYFSILTGEAVYHLRSALDHLIFELIRANKREPSRENMWPVLSTTHESSLKTKMKGVSTTACKLIESFQPYNLGTRYKEHSLWKLNKLSNWDKHNFLIRAFLARPGGIVIEWVDSNGRAAHVGQYTTEKVEPGYKFSCGPGVGIRPEMDIKIRSEPKVMLEDICGLETETVIPILSKLSDIVQNIVQSFRGEFS